MSKDPPPSGRSRPKRRRKKSHSSSTRRKPSSQRRSRSNREGDTRSARNVNRSRKSRRAVQHPPHVSQQLSRPSLRELLSVLAEWFNVPRNLDRKPDTDMRPLSVNRIRTISFVLGSLFLILISRSAYLMLLPNEKLSAQASQQLLETKVISGRRGDIYDRNKNLLASSVSLREIVIDPQMIDDEHIPTVATLLQHYLEVDSYRIEERIRKKRAQKSRYMVVAKKITPKQFAALKNEMNRRISEAKDNRAFRKSFRKARNSLFAIPHHYRFYTGREEAAPILGGVYERNHHGVGGLEHQYDSVLRGNEFVTIRKRDRQNNVLGELSPEEATPQAQDGQSLVLTLDRRIQHVTEKALRKAVLATGATSAIGMVMDVRTGQILSAASQPTANINRTLTNAERKRLKPHVFIDAYEAGSVIKPIIAAAAIEEGLYAPSTLMDCKGGYWRIHGMSIRDDHPKTVLSLSDVIKHSSNIGAAQLVLALGKESTYDYLQAFGFGRNSGLEFPAEPRGVLRAPKNIKNVNLITMSYGYGMTMTLTQLVSAYAALGNGGILMKPMLVQEILNSSGEVIQKMEAESIERVVSPTTSRQMLEMMKTVVVDGTAQRASVPGYTVAGKTGTAKKASEGGYSATDRIGSFIGLIPADNPVLAIGVSVDTPTVGLAYGGVVAAPVFSEIAEQAMRILGVEPDNNIVQAQAKVEAIGQATIPEVIWLNSNALQVPDLSGLTLRDSLSSLQVANLTLEFEGSGRVVKQVPAAGSEIRPGERLRLILR